MVFSRGCVHLTRRFCQASAPAAWTENTCKEIEKKWRGKLREHLKQPNRWELKAKFRMHIYVYKFSNERVHLTQSISDASTVYVLSMFPYPSGALHMGHVRVYSISDSLAHFYRLRGHPVIHPMGWDAFGLPAENAAIERGVRPQQWTSDNIASMRRRLDELGCVFDWEREVATCEPDYYRWTQWIFLKMMEAGLAYQRRAVVNWDPVDRTVLADEQVDAEGRSWRSGALVQRRSLKQWFLRSTDFSKALVDGLEDPSLHNWRDITKVQQNWIGECDGTRLKFGVVNAGEEAEDTLDVWTGHIERIFGASHLAISTEHVLYRNDLIQECES